MDLAALRQMPGGAAEPEPSQHVMLPMHGIAETLSAV